MAELNKLEGIVVGQYGVAVEVQVVDSDGDAIDLSTYTGITFKFRSPDGKTSISLTGAFSTDGSDGKCTFTPSSSVYFTTDGEWNGQIEFTKTGVVTKTVRFTVDVDETL